MPGVQVFHIEKRVTITGGLNRHITRFQWVDGKLVVWVPDNADPELTKNNIELVSREFVNSEGRKRTLSLQQAVNKRIEEAGIKPRKGQTRCLEMIFSGSHDEMCNMSREELLKWADDTLKWAEKTWDKENVVSASLHVDEKTPHIHMIVVPIVKGQSRRSKKQMELDKERGIKRNTYKINTEKLRLCANEVYTTPLLYHYHDHYAKDVSNKYGLERGLRAEPGSKKKHQTSEDYNRQLKAEAAEKRLLIAEIQADYKKAYKKKEDLESVVKNLETKSSSLSGDIESKENEFSELENRIKEEEDASWAVKNMLEKHIANCKAKYKNIETAIENRQEEIRSLKSAGIAQLIKDIPNLIKKDIQKIVEKSWNGELISCEEKEYQTNGQTEKFIEIKMKNAGKEYEFMVWERNGRIFKDGKWYKWEKTKEDAYMPELASYFTQELTEEAKEFVKSLYKVEPTKTEKNKNISKNKERGI